MAQKLILVCWLVFLAYWLISAFSTKKTAERPSLAAMLLYRIPFALGAVLLFKPLPLASWDILLLPHIVVVQVIAVGLCILGLLGALWARRTLGKNWSGEVVFKEEHELVERGPYRFVRHPIYTSILLMALGRLLNTGLLGALVGFLILIVGVWIKLKQEEALMLKHFPTQYAAYKSRVKALIPFVL